MSARSTKTASVRRAREPTAAHAGSKQPSHEDGAKPRNARDVRSAARREAILSAALDEFSSRGFAAARLDDVAKRAGVAKGTIYLYFADKETLFQELVRSMLTPLIGQFEALATIDIPFPRTGRAVGRCRDPRGVRIASQGHHPADHFRGAALPGDCGVLLPRGAEPGLRGLAADSAARIRTRGIRHRGLVAFPQLLAAPVLVGIVWSGLFDKQAPLDVRAMLNAHLDILFDRDGGRS